MLPCFSSTKNCCRGPTALENWQFARTRISRINPSMHLSSVLLPAPLGPMMPTNSPRAMRNDTERRRLERCGDGGIGQADVFGLRKTLVGEPVDSALLQVLLHGDDLGHLLEHAPLHGPTTDTERGGRAEEQRLLTRGILRSAEHLVAQIDPA